MARNSLEALTMVPAFSGCLCLVAISVAGWWGKSRPNKTSNTNSTLNFSVNLTKLSRPSFWLPKTLCHKAVFIYICSHLPRFTGDFLCKYIHGISLQYPGIHALLRNLKWFHHVILIYLKTFSKRGSEVTTIKKVSNFTMKDQYTLIEQSVTLEHLVIL